MNTMDQTVAEPTDPTKKTTFSFEQEASPTALALVRADFNPGHYTDVARLKLLCAALITEAEKLRDRPLLSELNAGGSTVHVPDARKNVALRMAQHNAKRAIDLLEDAAMHLVKAATA